MKNKNQSIFAITTNSIEMNVLLFIKIACILVFHTATRYPQELDLIKPFFFNAPIENFDSTTLFFFKTDSSFKYQAKKGEWSAVYNGVQVNANYQDFYFNYHPVFKNSFDTGKISFYYPERSGNQYLFSITLQLDFQGEEECSNAYNIILNKLETLQQRTVEPNGEIIGFSKEKFNHFKHIYLSYRKKVSFDSTIVHFIDLRGK